MAPLSYTNEQRAVLDWFRHESGQALIVAVAGAGKTTTLLEGIKVLVTERGVDPRDILMATFSKRGATDMATRATELAVPAGVEYRTLHSVAFEMVRAAGHRRRLEVAKDWHIKHVIKDTIKTLYLSKDDTPKIGEVASEIGRAKAALIWPTEWTSANGDRYPGYLEWAGGENATILGTVTETCYTALEAAMSAPESHGFDMANTRLITFDDMLAVSARACLRGERRDSWVDSFKGCCPWTLADEVQDENLAQWVLVKHLAGSGNLVAVGDDQQSIFGFRGAMPKLMRDFLDRGATLFTLSLNWRSGWKLLDAANAILDGTEDRLWDGGLVPGRGRDVFAGLPFAVEYSDPAEEARSVVGDIVEAIEGGESPDEIACLYRLNACSGPLEVALIARGIAYRVAGSSFFGRGAIRAAVGYIAAALDEDDSNGWRFGRGRGKSGLALCYATPLRGIGGAFLRQYPTVRAIRNASRSDLGRWWRGARGLLNVIDGVQSRLAEFGLGKALSYLFEDAGLREFFRDDGATADDETETDVACSALLDCSEQIGTAEDMVEFALSMTGTEDHTGDRTSRHRVTLSTAHKSKGLEWDRTYVVGMSEGLFPFRRNCVQEERRLAYVATTRARYFCQVSWTVTSGDKPAGIGVFAGEWAGRISAHEEGIVAA